MSFTTNTAARRRVVPTLLAGMLMAAACLAPAQAQNLRIMPVGDSVTEGVGTPSGNSYRGWLFNQLMGEVNYVNFVGSSRDGTMLDPDNEGHSGWKINDIAGIISGSLSKYRPNLVTLHIGTNDINGNIDVDAAPNRLSALIDRIFAFAPDATLLTAAIITSKNANTAARVATYNQHVREIVQARANAGQRIILVDMGAVNPNDLSDDLHPNDSGYQKMATAWNAGIERAIANGWVGEPVAVAENLVGAQSKRCLDVNGASNANGATVLIWDCHNGANQQWTPRPNGTLEVFPGKCLDVLGGSTLPGATVGIWGCNGGGNQQWRFMKNGTIVNAQSSLCLDVSGNATDNGSKVSVWNCNGGGNQMWQLR